MSGADYHGVFPYLVSPVGAEGKIGDEVLAALVEHLIYRRRQPLYRADHAAAAAVLEVSGEP